MKKIMIMCLAVILTLSALSCSSGGTGNKGGGTIENNRVIGEAGEKGTAPSASKSPSVKSSSAEETGPAATTAPRPTVPPAFQQSGTVKDNQDAPLGLRLDWTASRSGEGILVETRLYLECYSLMASSPKSGYVSVNGQKRSFRTEKISEEEIDAVQQMIDRYRKGEK